MSWMSRKLRTALGLSAAERALFCRAWIRLLRVGLALRSLPLPEVQKLAAGARPLPSPLPASRVAYLVAAAARHHLLTLRCLPRAVVLQSLLRDQVIQTDLRIGVRRIEKNMEAHAWIERDGQVIGDSPEVVRLYLPLEQPRLAGESTSPSLA
jgi:hypothetical protein